MLGIFLEKLDRFAIIAAQMNNSSTAVVALLMTECLTEAYNVTIAHVLVKVKARYLRTAVSLRALSLWPSFELEKA